MADTAGYLAYDKDNLHVAVRCQEPNLSAVKAATKDRDGDIFSDDSIEFFIATTADRKMYYQFAANSVGAFYDGRCDVEKWDSRATAAVARASDGWSVELAIPWKDLGVASPKAGDKVAVLFARSRRQTSETLQWPASPRGNHQPAAFAEVIMGR